MRASFLAAMASLLAAVNGEYELYFEIGPIETTDFHNGDHCAEFTVANPKAFSEQGGSAPANCTIAWNGEPATCYTDCKGPNTYHARVTPGSYKSAANFKLDIVQDSFYYMPGQNRATVNITTGGNGTTYACSKSGEDTVCEIHGGPHGFRQDETLNYQENRIDITRC